MIDLILSPFSFATMHHFCVDSATKTTVVHEFKTDITETLLAASFPGLPHRTGGKEDLRMVFYCPWLEQVLWYRVINSANDSKLRWNRWTIDFNDECKPLTHVWICNQHAQKFIHQCRTPQTCQGWKAEMLVTWMRLLMLSVCVCGGGVGGQPGQLLWLHMHGLSFTPKWWGKFLPFMSVIYAWPLPEVTVSTTIYIKLVLPVSSLLLMDGRSINQN